MDKVNIADDTLVVAAGHICLDVIPDLTELTGERLARLLQPGRLSVVGPVQLSTGGAASNTGLIFNRLGIPAQIMGKVGDDLFGAVVHRIIEKQAPGRSSGMISDPQAHTSYTVIINPPGVDRIFLHFPGANDTFRAEDVQYDVVQRASLFHFGYPPLMEQIYQGEGQELVEMMRRVKALGVTTSLDMAFPDPQMPVGQAPWRVILERVLPWVDIFLPSLEETLFMLRKETYRDLAEGAPGGDLLAVTPPELVSELGGELLSLGAKMAGIKLGYRGMYLRTASGEVLTGMGRAAPTRVGEWECRELWAPCFKVQVAGATGSGDATIAGFLSGLLRGLSAEQALRAAAAVGACNVEAPDALSGIQPWQATLERIAAGWEQISAGLENSSWIYHPATLVYQKRN
jgi:sugar/nucleoside kinase (ribokinase family)